MTSRGRSSNNSPASPANRTQIIVFSEGEKTETMYLTHWHRIYRERVIVTLSRHEYTTPFEIVTSACSQRSRDLREEKRGRGKAYDQYWCVFDVDEHPRIPEALQLAAANNISVALSSPCIELWFILHFQDQTAHIHRHEAQRESRTALGCGKSLTEGALERLVSNYEKAKERALALAAKHEGDGSARPWNPHSEAWKLIDVISGNE